MKTRVGTVAAAAALVFASGAFAADGAEVIARSEQKTKSASEKTLFRMELMDAQGRVAQVRDIELHFKRKPGAESTLFKFTAPPVVQGTGLLIVDQGQAVNDIWMYLPATRRIRRIAGAEKSNWFMGTEFTHEDFEDYKRNAYRFHLDGDDEPCGTGQRCFVVTATASDATEREASGYGRKVYWIERESLYPIRIDYVDRAGANVKRLDVRKLGRAGSHWRPDVYEMHNLVNGRVTRLTATARQVDVDLDDHYVSQRYLRSE